MNTVKMCQVQFYPKCEYELFVPILFDPFISSVDQEQLDKEINDLRKGLKAKVNRLNEMQGMRSISAVQVATCNTQICGSSLIFGEYVHLLLWWDHNEKNDIMSVFRLAQHLDWKHVWSSLINYSALFNLYTNWCVKKKTLFGFMESYI